MRFSFIVAMLVLFVLPKPVVGQSDPADPNLHLFIEPNSFTVYVSSAESVSLIGLGFRYVDSRGLISTTRLMAFFNELLLSDGIAQPQSCFIFVQQGTTPVLPGLCADRDKVFRKLVAPVDVFWYDFLTNRLRDISIVSIDTPTKQICTAADVDCAITYIAPADQISSSTPNESSVQAIGFVPIKQNASWTPITHTFNNVDMVLVPSGCFLMGSDQGDPDEQPVHHQCFDKPFWIDVYEVTNADYGSSGAFKASSNPRDNVNWFEAKAFCESRNARLPTEVEWEYAGRGPDNLVYPWGNDYNGRNVVDLNSSTGKSAAVGSRPNGVSWVGAFDLSGNLWEWVSSIRQPYPYVADASRENNEDTKSYRAMRGGSWKTPNHERTRLSFRSYADSVTREDWLGFRCVRDFQPEDLPS